MAAPGDIVELAANGLSTLRRSVERASIRRRRRGLSVLSAVVGRGDGQPLWLAPFTFAIEPSGTPIARLLLVWRLAGLGFSGILKLRVIGNSEAQGK